MKARDMNYCFKRNERIVCKNVDDGPALIDPYRRTLAKLNPVALQIWQLLDGGHPAAVIIGILEDEFEVDLQSLEKDVESFLKELIRREMIG